MLWRLSSALFLLLPGCTLGELREGLDRAGYWFNQPQNVDRLNRVLQNPVATSNLIELVGMGVGFIAFVLGGKVALTRAVVSAANSKKPAS